MSIEFKIEEHIERVCAIKGWTLEINRVSFGVHAAMIDIRTWNEDHTKMGKGLRLSDDAVGALTEALNRMK